MRSPAGDNDRSIPCYGGPCDGATVQSPVLEPVYCFLLTPPARIGVRDMGGVLVPVGLLPAHPLAVYRLTWHPARGEGGSWRYDFERIVLC